MFPNCKCRTHLYLAANIARQVRFPAFNVEKKICQIVQKFPNKLRLVCQTQNDQIEQTWQPFCVNILPYSALSDISAKADGKLSSYKMGK